MKIAVIGKGLAAMGVIESLQLKYDDVEIDWIGPSIDDQGWPNCSRNSTAVVALHGIKEGLSPLGDDLYRAFFQTKDFIEKYRPAGVTKVSRYHVAKEDIDKLESRFGQLERHSFFKRDYLCFFEDAFAFNTDVFLSWWFQKLSSHSGVTSIEDYIVDILSNEAIGLKDTYRFDKVIDARGSLFPDALRPVKKVPGHYWLWENVDAFPIDENVVFTVNGHNLIYNKDESSLILGGSTEKDGVLAPRKEQLLKQRESFLEVFSEFEASMKIEEASLYTGTRVKGPKRMPFVFLQNENHIVVNGFYKNGYTLCHLMGQRVVESLTEVVRKKQLIPNYLYLNLNLK